MDKSVKSVLLMAGLMVGVGFISLPRPGATVVDGSEKNISEEQLASVEAPWLRFPNLVPQVQLANLRVITDRAICGQVKVKDRVRVVDYWQDFEYSLERGSMLVSASPGCACQGPTCKS